MKNAPLHFILCFAPPALFYGQVLVVVSWGWVTPWFLRRSGGVKPPRRDEKEGKRYEFGSTVGFYF